jgi:hypothetical protein
MTRDWAKAIEAPVETQNLQPNPESRTELKSADMLIPSPATTAIGSQNNGGVTEQKQLRARERGSKSRRW